MKAIMHWSQGQGSALRKLRLPAIFLGLSWAVGAALAACALMCAWVMLAPGPVYYFSAYLTASFIIGAFVGGFVSGKMSGNLGLVHGFLTGLLYGLLLVSLFLAGSAESLTTGEMAARGLLLGIAGSLGGLLGVNLPARKLASTIRKGTNQSIF